MEQFKPAQVIMLPTRSNLEFPYIAQNVFNKQLTIVNSTFAINCELQSQHLYIISDHEIKEGDWILRITDNKLFRHNPNYYNHNVKAHGKDICKKIIATTDDSLLLKAKIGEDRYKLPQPSQQFIQKHIESYNKGQVIISVLIEYEKNSTWITTGYCQGGEVEGFWKANLKLKVNSKDNTINIKQSKTNWNKEEVTQLLIDCCSEISCEDGTLLGKTPSELVEWIEKRL